MPWASNIMRAFNSTPELGAPTPTRLPFMSSKVLMPESAVVTIWQMLGHSPIMTRRSAAGSLPS